MDMIRTAEDIPDQTGRTVLVTGANSGIGFEAAKGLAAKGATVVLGCRNAERGRQAVDEIRAEHPDTDVEVLKMDLASLASVRAAADQSEQAHDKLDVLVNNAGVMAPPRREETALPVVPAQPPAMGALATLQAAAGPNVEGDDYFGPNGPLEMGGTPSPSRRSAIARSEGVAKRLWDESVELTGVEYDLAG